MLFAERNRLSARAWWILEVVYLQYSFNQFSVVKANIGSGRILGDALLGFLQGSLDIILKEILLRSIPILLPHTRRQFHASWANTQGLSARSSSPAAPKRYAGPEYVRKYGNSNLKSYSTPERENVGRPAALRAKLFPFRHGLNSGDARRNSASFGG